VPAPIVGTYYEAASPGADNFVRVGDYIKPGKVVCIIESMKLMNEIEAEISGPSSIAWLKRSAGGVRRDALSGEAELRRCS